MVAYETESYFVFPVIYEITIIINEATQVIDIKDRIQKIQIDYCKCIA